MQLRGVLQEKSQEVGKAESWGGRLNRSLTMGVGQDDGMIEEIGFGSVIRRSRRGGVGPVRN